MILVSVLSGLVAGGLLSAATAPQPYHRPLAFEPNQGQAPAQFKWLGQSSSYQVLFDGESATIVIPGQNGLAKSLGAAARNTTPSPHPAQRHPHEACRESSLA